MGLETLLDRVVLSNVLTAEKNLTYESRERDAFGTKKEVLPRHVSRCFDLDGSGMSHIALMLDNQCNFV